MKSKTYSAWYLVVCELCSMWSTTDSVSHSHLSLLRPWLFETFLAGLSGESYGHGRRRPVTLTVWPWRHYCHHHHHHWVTKNKTTTHRTHRTHHHHHHMSHGHHVWIERILRTHKSHGHGMCSMCSMRWFFFPVIGGPCKRYAQAEIVIITESCESRTATPSRHCKFQTWKFESLSHDWGRTCGARHWFVWFSFEYVGKMLGNDSVTVIMTVTVAVTVSDRDRDAYGEVDSGPQTVLVSSWLLSN